MVKYNERQRLFIHVFQQMVNASKVISARDFIFIPPCVTQISKLFIGLYDVETGVGFGMSLEAFLVRSFREDEAAYTITKLLDGTIKAIKETGYKKNPINIKEFSLGIQNCTTIFQETRIIGGKKLHIFKLEHLSTAQED